ncbi:MAG: outer membrane beta-barrel protein [Fluviicola sp.]|nr:outer membrane beta-barrel protein [Fluviicola sp.]
MKKLSLLVGGLILSTAVMAQKPDASVHNTLEGLINWNTSSLSFTAPSLRYRYFVQDNIAVRVTLGLDNNSTTDNFFENGDGTGATGSYESKSNFLNFGIGAEYHFGGTDRLSPYAGLEIMLGSGKNTDDGANSDGTSYVADYTETSEAKASMFGVNVVAGADYYFAENFYMGLELGLAWSSFTDKEGETSVTTGGTTFKTVTAEQKSSFLSTGAVGTFRLGWRF